MVGLKHQKAENGFDKMKGDLARDEPCVIIRSTHQGGPFIGKIPDKHSGCPSTPLW